MDGWVVVAVVDVPAVVPVVVPAAVLVAGAGAGVELGAGVGVACVGVEVDAGAGGAVVVVGGGLEELVSGSTYCWSPADVPEPASAAAGPSSDTNAITTKQLRMYRGLSTPRVLHR